MMEPEVKSTKSSSSEEDNFLKKIARQSLLSYAILCLIVCLFVVFSVFSQA